MAISVARAAYSAYKVRVCSRISVRRRLYIFVASTATAMQRHKMQFCTFASWLALVASGFSCYRYVCVFCLGACVCLAERFVYHLRTKWANALVYTCVYTDRHWLPSGASCRFPLAPLAPCLHSCVSAWLTSERLPLIIE